MNSKHEACGTGLHWRLAESYAASAWDALSDDSLDVVRRPLAVVINETGSAANTERAESRTDYAGGSASTRARDQHHLLLADGEAESRIHAGDHQALPQRG